MAGAQEEIYRLGKGLLDRLLSALVPGEWEDISELGSPIGITTTAADGNHQGCTSTIGTLSPRGIKVWSCSRRQPPLDGGLLRQLDHGQCASAYSSRSDRGFGCGTVLFLRAPPSLTLGLMAMKCTSNAPQPKAIHIVTYEPGEGAAWEPGKSISGSAGQDEIFVRAEVVTQRQNRLTNPIFLDKA